MKAVSRSSDGATVARKSMAASPTCSSSNSELCSAAAAAGHTSHSCRHRLPSSCIRALRQPRVPRASAPTSGIQSGGEYQRTKSSSSACGLAALKADMSERSCATPTPSEPVFIMSSSVSRIMSSVSTGASCVCGAKRGSPLRMSTSPAICSLWPQRICASCSSTEGPAWPCAPPLSAAAPWSRPAWPSASAAPWAACTLRRASSRCRAMARLATSRRLSRAMQQLMSCSFWWMRQ
mmetsp:Transcript_10501/g.38651  ORF Transcript_10501/g.38651 Transcript_10501/m.38651 type:complete len:236 (+) Transcript_10501:483-1190(+)